MVIIGFGTGVYSLWEPDTSLSSTSKCTIHRRYAEEEGWFPPFDRAQYILQHEARLQGRSATDQHCVVHNHSLGVGVKKRDNAEDAVLTALTRNAAQPDPGAPISRLRWLSITLIGMPVVPAVN